MNRGSVLLHNTTGSVAPAEVRTNPEPWCHQVQAPTSSRQLVRTRQWLLSHVMRIAPRPPSRPEVDCSCWPTCRCTRSVSFRKTKKPFIITYPCGSKSRTHCQNIFLLSRGKNRQQRGQYNTIFTGELVTSRARLLSTCRRGSMWSNALVGCHISPFGGQIPWEPGTFLLSGLTWFFLRLWAWWCGGCCRFW